MHVDIIILQQDTHVITTITIMTFRRLYQETSFDPLKDRKNNVTLSPYQQVATLEGRHLKQTKGNRRSQKTRLLLDKRQRKRLGCECVSGEWRAEQFVVLLLKRDSLQTLQRQQSETSLHTKHKRQTHTKKTASCQWAAGRHAACLLLFLLRCS